VEKVMEDVAAREASAIASKVRPLLAVGGIAPLVGLLGTVVGMIFSFRIASQAGLGKAELLAEGIYLALLTTAVGLIIAVPTMLFAAYFQGRADHFLRETNDHLLHVLPRFADMEQAPKPQGASHSSVRGR
jgi:biopolymer transport protein ExbB